MKKKFVSVITTTRADYGILTPLVRELAGEPLVDLELVVTGTHFSVAHGNTYKDLGFAQVSHFIDLGLEELDFEIHNVFSRMLQKIKEYLASKSVDCVIILGDRFEILAAALAAYFMKVPIVHLHGGEKTLGAQDEAFRHCITKLSNLHFTANEEFRNRVIQLGEEPSTVFDVGALGIDNISSFSKLSRIELYSELDLRDGLPFILVSYHPETLSDRNPGDVVENICNALYDFFGDSMQFVIIGPNMDPGFESILQTYKLYEQDDNFNFFENISSPIYLSAMHNCEFMIGNSSSAIIESTYLATWAVNVGDRQAGRPCDENVINCGNEMIDLKNALKKLSTIRELQSEPHLNFIYGNAGVAKNITDVIKQTDFKSLGLKSFFDILTEVQ